MNRDLQIGDAKARAIGMAESGFRPPRPTSFLLPGANGRATGTGNPEPPGWRHLSYTPEHDGPQPPCPTSPHSPPG